jgi:hypothetical protein
MTAHAHAATTEPAPNLTHWERVGQTTSWGRYLAEIEGRAILRGAELAEKPGHAIDMGCGGGRWSKLLSDRGWKMTCTDVDSHALSICQHTIPTANCFLARPEDRSIPVDSNSAGLMLCIEVVPLIEADWFAPEAHRVLSDGGLLVGVYINGRSWRAMAWRIKQRLTRAQDGDQFYQAAYSDCRRRLIATGFEMVHEESFCWGPFTRDSNSPLVPAVAKVERALGLHRVVSWSPWVVFIARKKGLATREPLVRASFTSG